MASGLSAVEQREARARAARVRREQAERAARNGVPPPAVPTPPAVQGETLHAVLMRYLRDTYRPLHRRGDTIYADALGERIDLRRAGLGPPSPLLDRLLTATDSPKGRDGAPSVPGLLRVWRQYLAVAWADLLAALPDEPDAAEVSAGAAEELRRQLAGVLGRVVTIGRHVGSRSDTDVQARSLLDCCLVWAVPGEWARVRSYWLWCRLDGSEPAPQPGDIAVARVAALAKRRRRLRVALRAELLTQLAIRDLADWPARRLSALCALYGLGQPVRIGHHRQRGIELARELLADLLGEPDGEGDRRDV